MAKSKSKKPSKNGSSKKTKGGPRMAPPVQKVEIVVRQESQAIVPSTQDLSEPMRDGKKLTIPKTWVNENQLTFMLQKTPSNQVYKRKGRGGKMFDYVTISYMQRALNYAFGWNWDFEIVEHGKEADHVWVLGKLTVRGSKPGEQITKTQFGRSDVKKLREGGGNVDYGNDLKGAASDALKKCASLLGFASDIYGKMEYKDESGQEPRDNNPPPQSLPPAPAKSEPIDIPCVGATKNGCPTGEIIKPNQRDYSIRFTGRALCKDCFSEFTSKQQKKK
jgi:hypothetical protein